MENDDRNTPVAKVVFGYAVDYNMHTLLCTKGEQWIFSSMPFLFQE